MGVDSPSHTRGGMQADAECNKCTQTQRDCVHTPDSLSVQLVSGFSDVWLHCVCLLGRPAGPCIGYQRAPPPACIGRRRQDAAGA
jgi:hypothetical protein